jgi:phosphinothricin acetyltransferase
VKRDDWPLEDPKGKPIDQVRAIRDEIRTRVRDLIVAEGWARAERQTSTIRLASEADATAVAAIYRPIVASTAISFEAEPPDEQEMRRRIAETLTSHPWLVFEIAGEAAGFAYASRHRQRAAYQWSVDTSAYVDERFRRRGVGRALYVSLFAILSAQGFVNAYAGIALPNAASVALHEAVGFAPVGIFRNVGYKFGAWRDVGWWQRALNSHDASPARIKELGELRQHPEWQDLLNRGLLVSDAHFPAA